MDQRSRKKERESCECYLLPPFLFPATRQMDHLLSGDFFSRPKKRPHLNGAFVAAACWSMRKSMLYFSRKNVVRPNRGGGTSVIVFNGFLESPRVLWGACTEITSRGHVRSPNSRRIGPHVRLTTLPLNNERARRCVSADMPVILMGGLRRRGSCFRIIPGFRRSDRCQEEMFRSQSTRLSRARAR